MFTFFQLREPGQNSTDLLYFLCSNRSTTVLLKRSKDTCASWLQTGRGRGHREPVLPGNKKALTGITGSSTRSRWFLQSEVRQQGGLSSELVLSIGGLSAACLRPPSCRLCGKRTNRFNFCERRSCLRVNSGD